VRLALRQAGVRTATPPKGEINDRHWAVLFPATEAKKLLFR
jgi:hypothetical protein